jgi:hypothetical protein
MSKTYTKGGQLMEEQKAVRTRRKKSGGKRKTTTRGSAAQAPETYAPLEAGSRDRWFSDAYSQSMGYGGGNGW